ncbi:MAG TPA: hypothetical protein VJ863_08930 [Sphaerochaeta sp.]|nr:hypothetical protein [Sphaerochaeta sp.]
MRKTLFTLCSLLCVSATLLVAAPNAERLFRDVEALDYQSQSLESIKSAYDALDDGIARDAQQARRDMLEAKEKGDLSGYLDAYARLDKLRTFRMKGEESNLLLGRIMAESEPKKGEYATWLYQRSDSYNPLLTLDFSAQGESFRYSYRQQIQKPPLSEVALPDYTQLRTNSSQVGILKGWGLTPDELTYKAGETIAMPYTNQTFHAIWGTGVRFVGESRDTLYEDVEIGSEVVVPTPSTSDEGAIFVGWYDRGTNTLLSDRQTYTVQGKGALFEPLWKSLAIPEVTELHYPNDALPRHTQLAVGFLMQNKGNLDLKGLEATLQTQSPYVTMLIDHLDVGSLSANRYATNNSRFATTGPLAIRGGYNTFRFFIADAAPSGSSIEFTLTLTDNAGASWSMPVVITVE